MKPNAPLFRHRPIRIAPDTWQVSQLEGESVAPRAVFINALVILGEEPTLIDTGAPNNRDAYLEDVFGLVDPTDVRWILLSHDDVDHWGNLEPLVESCPRATVVTSWFQNERLGCAVEVPLARQRWVGDGDVIDAGDRSFVAVTPPVFDSPTTRGFFDTKTRVYWAADAYSSPVPRYVEEVGQLDPAQWRDGFALYQQAVAPWHRWLDSSRWADAAGRIEALEPLVIATGHSPAITGPSVAAALEMMRNLPHSEPVELPGQDELDALLSAMRP